MVCSARARAVLAICLESSFDLFEIVILDFVIKGVEVFVFCSGTYVRGCMAVFHVFDSI